MKRLLCMLLILCVFAGLFACASTQEESTTATTTATQTTAQDVSASSVVTLVPDGPVVTVGPLLPTGTVPQISVPTDRPPDVTIPAPPPTSQPGTEYS